MHPETLVIGGYRVVAQLGRGADGVVYRVVEVETGRPAAVKTVTLPQGQRLESLRREVQALTRLRHPGIVRVLDHGVHAGLPWLALELVEGPDLLEHCRSLAGAPAGAWTAETLARALSPVRRLCGPLAYLHGMGLVHRDLKPGNVLVRPDGRPVLVDFGLSSQHGGAPGREAVQRSGSIVGTGEYMAPEQVRGEVVDARADLYALGCILFELLVGRPPFVAPSLREVARLHLRSEPARPAALGVELPRRLEELLARLLAKAPEQRLGYADDVARVLAELGAEDEGWDEAPRARSYLYRPRLVGRGGMLEAVERNLDEVDAGTGGALLLLGGESGVGKTRLATEVARSAARRGFLVSVGETQPRLDGRGSDGAAPLQPLGALLRWLGDACRERGAAETARVFGQRSRLLAAYEPALLELPGQDSEPEPAELPAGAARLRLFSALEAAIEAAAAEAPLLLALDDLQWADELTLALLEHLAGGERLRRLPVLILGTYRLEEAGAGLGRLLALPSVRALRLDRLEADAVGEMVAGMLALESEPRRFVELLHRQSEGNPFFVAEYLRVAVAEGLLRRDAEGRWQLELEAAEDASGAYEDLPLPQGIRELVALRLGTLGAPALELARAAAVLGREVDDVLLERLGEAHCDRARPSLIRRNRSCAGADWFSRWRRSTSFSRRAMSWSSSSLWSQ
jgi:eukaryotic-like serine/threonine-protein kinase